MMAENIELKYRIEMYILVDINLVYKLIHDVEMLILLN